MSILTDSNNSVDGEPVALFPYRVIDETSEGSGKRIPRRNCGKQDAISPPRAVFLDFSTKPTKQRGFDA